MRRLIGDIYNIIYKYLKIKTLSLFLAIVYIALLNMVILYGFCLLLEGIYPMLGYGLILFNKPFVYGIAILAIGINYILMIPLENLDKERNRPISITTILLYSLTALILFIYARYSERLFL